ncbi:MAG: acyl-[acyl-carrier-protein] thioesterase [Pseudobdellovibrionaceae bacterium]
MEEYKIASYLVNLRGKAGLFGVLNFIQDVGLLHAHHLQIQLKPNQTWVFTRQKLVMSRWPDWNQTMSIRTWLRTPVDQFFYRDYELYLGDQKIGECTSTFTVMDRVSRKLAKFDWEALPDVWRNQEILIHTPEKIKVIENAPTISEFNVRNTDLDMNHHVNNTKYAQWILDSIPLNVLQAGVDLNEYEVNFLAEVKPDETVAIQRIDQVEENQNSMISQFQGFRSVDGKFVFTARLKLSDSHKKE